MTNFTGSCAEMIRLRIEVAEKDLQYYFDKLDREGGGWDPSTTPMRDLKNAAQILRSLAATIEQHRLRLTEGAKVDE
jgi:hypothetical protein